MKLLIIAGPYEADRIRRAVVSAGFEAVAVEPGESLSGWITASRPDLIVMAPQIVNQDPAVALAKVRAVPRGRVPTLLVGDPDDEARLKGLADGFMARPLSTADLVARVRSRLGSGERQRAHTGEQAIPSGMTDGGSGEFAKPGASKPGSGPKAGGGGSGPSATPSGIGAAPASPGGHRPLPTLRPLVSSADVGAPVPRARTSEAGALLGKLAESIDAAFDAEMFDVARSVGALRRDPGPPPFSPGPRTGARRAPEDLFERTPMAPMTALAAAASLPAPGETTALRSVASFEAVEELHDETRQKTIEVPRDVFAKMIAERIAAARDGGGEAGAPAPVESGKIPDSDVAAQLGRMYLQRLTGRLVLRRDSIEKVIYFDRGAPILGMSSDPQDRMGEMLVRQGRLSEAQLAKASDGLGAERRLGLVLVELGFIKPGELPVVVRKHFEEIIRSTFAWEDGEWSLGPGQPDQEIVLLDEHPAAIILEGIRRKYSAARLDRCLGGGKQVFRPTGAPGSADVLQRMGLAVEERDLFDLFDGVRTLDEVRAKAGAREESVSGIAWALSVLGQLDRLDPRKAEPPQASVGATNGAANHGARPWAAERARVLARYALVEEGDYFQLLDLPRGATVEEVRRAHATLMRDLAPTSLPSSLVSELGAELRAIRVVLDEALRVLGEPDMRRRYETHLPVAAEHAAG
jgi:hypothetical protein